MKLLRRAAIRTYGTLFPDHAATWFERQLLTPRKAPRREMPAPTAPATRHETTGESGTLVITEWGAGPTVLLLHGWGGRAQQLQAFVDPLVAAGRRVVTFDFPAHGDSHGDRTNIIECSAAAIRIAGAFGPLEGVISHSFGGPVTAFAWSRGLRAGRVAMIAPPLSIRDLSLPIADWIGLPRHVAELMFTRFGDRHGVRWEDLQMDRLIGGLDAPLLVVHDEADEVVPWSHGAAIARAARQGRLHTTAGLGHKQVLSEPSVVQEVTAFVGGAAADRKTA